MIRMLRILVIVMVLNLVNFSIARGESLPDSAYIPGVIGHAQNYSISCEARSAADLAGFWGYSIGETEFLQSLPSSDNPDEGYVGNPNEVWGRIPPNGYGVHAGPVAATLREFGLSAEARRDLNWDDLRGEISAGRPVIVWVIGAMWTGTAVDYEASDGSTSRVAAFEHTMLLTGYSTETVEVIDAYSGQYQYYWLSAFLNSWGVLGNMAVFTNGEGQQQAASPPQIQGNTYTVQPGDYLMQLARDFDTSWQELAELNSIGYPYTIYTGQVLQLPEAASQNTTVDPEPLATPVEPASTPRTMISRIRLPILMRDNTPQRKSVTASLTSTPEPIKTVTVLHTDTLISFGRSIGVAWHVLAELNNLPPTYIVHPGEILKVK